MVKEIAYGRVGLLGNPSDIYGGKTISFTFDRFAEVEILSSNKFAIISEDKCSKLILATIEYLNLSKKTKNIQINCKTNIPPCTGLGGSSAIIIATIKCLNNYFHLGMDKYQIAESALHVETDILNISAGFQDRYAISFGGLVYMNFKGKEFMRSTDPYGEVEKIPINKIPCFLCLSKSPKVGSAQIHNQIRREFIKGGKKSEFIKRNMELLADSTLKGRTALIRKDWKALGELMNENYRIRNEVFPIFKSDKTIIQEAIKAGAFGAKLAGSGGAIVVLANNEVYHQMNKNYPCIKPKIKQY